MCRVYIYDNCLILQTGDWTGALVLSVSTTMSMCEAVSMGDVKGTICIVCNPKVIFDIVNV